MLICLTALQLSGCAGGVDLSKIEVDDTLKTSAVNAPSAGADETRVSDMLTIRNAVSSADPEKAETTEIPWANADTGSRGAITSFAEYERRGLLCRKFEATRESFDGVALYAGDTCKVEDGSWQMLAFGETKS
jgi:surface antigen